MIHSLGGEEKALSMTYGEYFAYNKAAQDWLVFLIDRDALEGKTDAEEDAFYNKAEDFLWEDFKKRLALKRG